MNVRKKLLWAVIFNIAIVLAEVSGGILSKSIALLSDAVHNSTDVISMVFALIGSYIAARNENETFTYGYKRAEIVSSLVNSTFIIIMGGFILLEGIKKTVHPYVTNPKILLPVAFVGLLGNAFTLLILHEHHNEHLNVKAAWIHIMADTISSVLVVGLGVLFFYKDYYFLDGIVSVGIAVYMISMAIPIFRESSLILMQANTGKVSLSDVKEELLKIKEVRDVHHIHLWNLDEKNTHVELHIKKSENANNDDLLKKVYDKLKEIGISHATVQIEKNVCPDERGGD
ncbi:MAG: cation transporter [Thermotogaceae bacterium]|nr:cation transporter [Thermotogaceae bacterium]